MTRFEFLHEAKKLIEWKPSDFSSMRLDLIFSEISDMGAKWWTDSVKEIILSGNAKANIADMARSHRAAQGSLSRTIKIVDHDLETDRQISDDGLLKALNLFGTNNLLDAIAIARKRTK